MYYDADGNLVYQSNGMYFYYDKTGLYALLNGGNVYFCRKDAMGNIVALLDSSGAVVVKYTYDAWGNCRVLNPDGTENTEPTFVGNRNPFRYRGYYFDTETGLYFLKTRYYDPAIGRFMTLDDFAYLDPDHVNGLNLYAYCNNNPVMFFDPNGTFALSTFFLGLAISCFVGWVAGEILGAQLAGGIGSAVGGASTIATGISMFAFGPVGWVIGSIAVVAGVASIAFGSAEIQESLTGNNWIKDVTGWDSGVYNGIYLAANIVSIAATLGGSYYKNTMHGQRAFALQNVKNYSYTDTVKGHMNSYFGKKYGSTGIIAGNSPDIRPYTNSLWAQKTVIRYGVMTRDGYGWIFTLDGYRLGLNNELKVIWHFGRGF